MSFFQSISCSAYSVCPPECPGFFCFSRPFLCVPVLSQSNMIIFLLFSTPGALFGFILYHFCLVLICSMFVLCLFTLLCKAFLMLLRMSPENYDLHFVLSLLCVERGAAPVSSSSCPSDAALVHSFSLVCRCLFTMFLWP